ncbi:hypothetical protein GCM10010417_54470 [Streptomyces carpaticus]
MARPRAFGLWLWDLRAKADRTQTNIAGEAGVDRACYVNVENGKRTSRCSGSLCWPKRWESMRKIPSRGSPWLAAPTRGWSWYEPDESGRWTHRVDIPWEIM